MNCINKPFFRLELREWLYDNTMRNLILIILIVCTNLVTAQIKIGDNPQTLDATSLLELESSSKVLVISRMTEVEILALTPLQGAMVYNIDASCIFYYDGTVWNNLCDSGSTGSISWSEITGDLTTNPDLVNEFAKYVDLSTTQSIAGEKTLTEKFTVDTGDITDQSAEFLGTVKGEQGTAPEHFVTKAQLDASGGGGTWGSITGSLTDQTDLATEFQNYVNVTTIQTVAGEKTLTDKLTVNTGDITAQSAEFLGRVKGEPGTENEDFVTKAQLDASGGGGGAWGSITGALTDQTDLAAEFQNYINITTAQTVAGEKTLTDKLTVNTGDITAQSAEFLGRVKGENGTDPEDFVTRAQLDAVTSGGHTGNEGSIFFAGLDTQPTENNANLFWNNTNNQLRVGSVPPVNGTTNSTLNIQGSVSKPIEQGVTTLTEEHYTVTFNFAGSFIELPDATTCYGRIYVIKLGPAATGINSNGYQNNQFVFVNTLPAGKVTQLQSNGVFWEQINN